MPELRISVTDAQWARIQAAYTTRDDLGDTVIPDVAAMQTWILSQLRGRVQRYEFGQSSATAEAAKRSELEAEGW